MQTQLVTNKAQTVIRAARQGQSMTMRVFAAALAVSQNSVNQWEHGIAEPNDERIRAWLTDGRDWVKQMGLAIFWLRHGAEVSAMANTVPQPKPAEAA